MGETKNISAAVWLWISWPERNAFEKGLVLGIVGQDPQIDLRIVAGHKDMSLLRDKCLADALSLLGADGDILQVRVAAGKSPGGSNRLVEGGMHPACFRMYQAGQLFHIGGLQLAQVAVDEHCLGQLMKGELFKHLDIGGIACLGLAAMRQLELVKEYLSQLPGRIDIEFLAGKFIDLFFQFSQFCPEFLGQLLQKIGVHLDAGQFHLCQDRHQGCFQVCKKLPEILFFKLWPELFPQQAGAVHILAGIVLGIFKGDIDKSFRPLIALCHLREGCHLQVQDFPAEVIQLEGAPAGIKQVGCYHGIPERPLEGDSFPLHFDDGVVKLEVMPKLGQFLIFQERLQYLEHLFFGKLAWKQVCHLRPCGPGEYKKPVLD